MHTMSYRTRSILGAAAVLAVGAVSAMSFGAGDLSSAGLVVLNTSADGALSMTGSSAIHIPAATVYVNSSSRNAVRTVGNAVLDTPELKIVGQANFGGQSSCTGAVHRVNMPFADPLNPFAVPSPGGMTDRGRINANSNSALTLQPGRYSGGIVVTGNAALTLQPGLYLIDNGLDIRSGSVNGTGVTIIVTSGSFKIAGTSALRLSPPREGSMAGLVMAMAPTNSQAMMLTGGSEVDISGTIYAKASTLTLRGNSTLTNQGPTMGDLVIADKVELVGTGSIKIGHPMMPAVQLPAQPIFD
jgi:hypothetical protein